MATNGDIFGMNGRLRRDEAAGRLAGAFLLSCLLHAAVLFSVYLGMHADEPSHQHMEDRRRAAPLSASLATRPLDARRSPAPSATTPAPKHENPIEAVPVPSSGTIAAEGIDLLPTAGAEYYATDQLTRRPQPLALADLEGPEIKPIVASGKMILKLWINPLGEIVDVNVESTTLPLVFTRAAIAAFRSSRFQPGERNGLPVGTVMRVEVSYDDGRMPAPDAPGSNSPVPWAAGKP